MLEDNSRFSTSRDAEVFRISRSARTRERAFVILACIVTIAFALPLWQLLRFAMTDGLQSYILGIPFICLFLIRFAVERSALNGTPSSLPAVLVAGLGCLALVAFFAVNHSTTRSNWSLTLSTLSFLCFLLAGALATLGWSTLRPHWFAISFLLFLIPLPVPVTNFFTSALQHATAEVAELTFQLIGMPAFRQGLAFQLPGMTILVAEECSGIRSTLVLLITSLLASHLFLRTCWKKAFLVVLIFPLGVFRNALRITVISWLTVNVDREVVNSALHHRGGPLFFAVSLIPLFGMLLWFRRTDLKRAKIATMIPTRPDIDVE
jgi:exosortase C (VPDSG-CTERM-specific)